MSNRNKTLASLLALMSLSSALTATSFPKRTSAQHIYTEDFVAQYANRCQRELLSTKRYTVAKASSVCRCSLNNLQQDKTQSAALSFLITQEAASRFGDRDARTGLPKKLTNDYFASCLG